MSFKKLEKCVRITYKFENADIRRVQKRFIENLKIHFPNFANELLKFLVDHFLEVFSLVVGLHVSLKHSLVSPPVPRIGTSQVK